MNATTDDRFVLSYDADASGAENMSLDLELFDQVRSGSITGAFRTYTWQPWAVSLGRHQSRDVIDIVRASELEIDIVTRPTGGRAVLHAEELTYCIVSRGNAREIYAGVHQVLQKAINSLLPDTVTQESDSHKLRQHYSSATSLGQACFAANAQHEILFNNRKLVGSAQRVADGVVLQHGSILCGNAHLLLADVLIMPDENRDAFRTGLQCSSASLSEALGRSITASEIRHAITSVESEFIEIMTAVRS